MSVALAGSIEVPVFDIQKYKNESQQLSEEHQKLKTEVFVTLKNRNDELGSALTELNRDRTTLDEEIARLMKVNEFIADLGVFETEYTQNETSLKMNNSLLAELLSKIKLKKQEVEEKKRQAEAEKKAAEAKAAEDAKREAEARAAAAAAAAAALEAAIKEVEERIKLLNEIKDDLETKTLDTLTQGVSDAESSITTILSRIKATLDNPENSSIKDQFGNIEEDTKKFTEEGKRSLDEITTSFIQEKNRIIGVIGNEISKLRGLIDKKGVQYEEIQTAMNSGVMDINQTAINDALETGKTLLKSFSDKQKELNDQERLLDEKIDEMSKKKAETKRIQAETERIQAQIDKYNKECQDEVAKINEKYNLVKESKKRLDDPNQREDEKHKEKTQIGIAKGLAKIALQHLQTYTDNLSELQKKITKNPENSNINKTELFDLISKKKEQLDDCKVKYNEIDQIYEEINNPSKPSKDSGASTASESVEAKANTQVAVADAVSNQYDSSDSDSPEVEFLKKRSKGRYSVSGLFEPANEEGNEVGYDLLVDEIDSQGGGASQFNKNMKIKATQYGGAKTFILQVRNLTDTSIKAISMLETPERAFTDEVIQTLMTDGATQLDSALVDSSKMLKFDSFDKKIPDNLKIASTTVKSKKSMQHLMLFIDEKLSTGSDAPLKIYSATIDQRIKREYSPIEIENETELRKPLDSCVQIYNELHNLLSNTTTSQKNARPITKRFDRLQRLNVKMNVLNNIEKIRTILGWTNNPKKNLTFDEFFKNLFPELKNSIDVRENNYVDYLNWMLLVAFNCSDKLENFKDFITTIYDSLIGYVTSEHIEQSVSRTRTLISNEIFTDSIKNRMYFGENIPNGIDGSMMLYRQVILNNIVSIENTESDMLTCIRKVLCENSDSPRSTMFTLPSSALSSLKSKSVSTLHKSPRDISQEILANASRAYDKPWLTPQQQEEEERRIQRRQIEKSRTNGTGSVSPIPPPSQSKLDSDLYSSDEDSEVEPDEPFFQRRAIDKSHTKLLNHIKPELKSQKFESVSPPVSPRDDSIAPRKPQIQNPSLNTGHNTLLPQSKPHTGIRFGPHNKVLPLNEDTQNSSVPSKVKRNQVQPFNTTTLPSISPERVDQSSVSASNPSNVNPIYISEPRPATQMTGSDKLLSKITRDGRRINDDLDQQGITAITASKGLLAEREQPVIRPLTQQSSVFTRKAKNAIQPYRKGGSHTRKKPRMKSKIINTRRRFRKEKQRMTRKRNSRNNSKHKIKKARPASAPASVGSKSSSDNTPR